MATDGDGMPTEREILEGLRCPHDGFDPRFCDICMGETPTRVKFLTLHQPWASLVALGAKTIETRSWSTKYRGPLAIHAGMRQVHSGKFIWLARLARKESLITLEQESVLRAIDVPFGAIVAVCDLVDVAPIIAWHEVAVRAHARPFQPYIFDNGADVWQQRHSVNEAVPLKGQRSFGDFHPGRYAWLLDNVRALPKPIPMKGAQGLRDLPADIEEQLTVQHHVDPKVT